MISIQHSTSTQGVTVGECAFTVEEMRTTRQEWAAPKGEWLALRDQVTDRLPSTVVTATGSVCSEHTPQNANRLRPLLGMKVTPLA